MNVQDALAQAAQVTASVETEAAVVYGIKSFANETEATLAELLGTENEAVGLFAQVSVKAAEVSVTLSRLKAQLDELTAILSAIQ